MQEDTNQMTEKLNNFNKYNKLIKENLLFIEFFNCIF